MTPDQPLDGVRVIDAASLYAGPLTGMLLGDFGAEVVKVEHPGSGDALRDFGDYPEELSWKWVNRNKKSVPLDLHAEAGQAAFTDLVADADVLIENFRPGTLENWNVGWESLSAVNEDLVMVRVTGFGQTGPYSDRPGFGTLVEAMSGYAYSTGQPDSPPTLPPTAMADTVCALNSAYAAMVALYWRDVQGGSGQYIDASILETMFGVLGDHVIEHEQKAIDHRRSGNRSSRTAPRNTYRTKDDRWVAISGSSSSIAERILRVVGGEKLVEDSRFETMEGRLRNVEELDEIIRAWMAKRTREEVIAEFEAHEAAIGPVYNMADIADDEHFEARDAVIHVAEHEDAETTRDDAGTATGDEADGTDEIGMRGVFPKLSETPGRVEHAGPEIGSHTREILTERTDLTGEEVERLAEAGVTRLADGNGKSSADGEQTDSRSEGDHDD